MINVPVEKDGKRPIVLNDQVGTSIKKGYVVTNGHEVSGSGSNSEYFMPRWYPPGLTRTQRKKTSKVTISGE
jgi:hypothetical protein